MSHFLFLFLISFLLLISFLSHLLIFSSCLTSFSELFWSRALGVLLAPGGEQIASLVPLADMMNHSPSAKVTYMTSVASKSEVEEEKKQGEEEEGSFKLKVHEVVKKGSQVFNNYGKRSNEKLLLNYGFMLEDNRDQEAYFVKLGFEGDPFKEQKMELMETKKLGYGLLSLSLPPSPLTSLPTISFPTPTITLFIFHSHTPSLSLTDSLTPISLSLSSSLIISLSFRKEHYLLSFEMDPDTPFSRGLLEALRICSMDEIDLYFYRLGEGSEESSFSSPSLPCLKSELKVCISLQQMLRSKLKRYPTTLEADKSHLATLLSSSSSSSLSTSATRELIIYRYLCGQKEVLHRALQEVSLSLSHLRETISKLPSSEHIAPPPLPRTLNKKKREDTSSSSAASSSASSSSSSSPSSGEDISEYLNWLRSNGILRKVNFDTSGHCKATQLIHVGLFLFTEIVLFLIFLLLLLPLLLLKEGDEIMSIPENLLITKEVASKRQPKLALFLEYLTDEQLLLLFLLLERNDKSSPWAPFFSE
jgi:hypothetical protein